MGKGDKRSRRGKIHIGSWGVNRLRKAYMTTKVQKLEAEKKN